MEFLSDRADRNVSRFEHGSDGLQILRTELPGPPAFTASGACGLEAGERALADQIALKLSQCSEDMECELPGRGSRVDLLGQRSEPYAARLEFVSQMNEVAQAAAQAIQAPDD